MEDSPNRTSKKFGLKLLIGILIMIAAPLVAFQSIKKAQIESGNQNGKTGWEQIQNFLYPDQDRSEQKARLANRRAKRMAPQLSLLAAKRYSPEYAPLPLSQAISPIAQDDIQVVAETPIDQDGNTVYNDHGCSYAFFGRTGPWIKKSGFEGGVALWMRIAPSDVSARYMCVISSSNRPGLPSFALQYARQDILPIKALPYTSKDIDDKLWVAQLPPVPESWLPATLSMNGWKKQIKWNIKSLPEAQTLINAPNREFQNTAGMELKMESASGGVLNLWTPRLPQCSYVGISNMSVIPEVGRAESIITYPSAFLKDPLNARNAKVAWNFDLPQNFLNPQRFEAKGSISLYSSQKETVVFHNVRFQEFSKSGGIRINYGIPNFKSYNLADGQNLIAKTSNGLFVKLLPIDAQFVLYPTNQYHFFQIVSPNVRLSNKEALNHTNMILMQISINKNQLSDKSVKGAIVSGASLGNIEMFSNGTPENRDLNNQNNVININWNVARFDPVKGADLKFVIDEISPTNSGNFDLISQLKPEPSQTNWTPMRAGR